MGTNSYFHIILGVLTNFYVIGTAVAMILVIEFAKFVTTYRKKPPRPKVKKAKTAPAVASASAEGEKAEGGEASTAEEGKSE